MEIKKITCLDISFSYGKGRKPVYNGYSRAFTPGVTMLKGYSGCGKTTLLKLLAGFLIPQAGDIFGGDKIPVTNHNYIRCLVGCCFQAMNLLPLATVRRNLEIAGALAGMDSEKIKNQSEKILEHMGIREYADVRPSELSGGQQKRAAIARALLKNPSVLLLDEPTSDLDDKNTEIIKRILSDLPRHVVCVMSSHDSRIESVCDEIVKLENVQ